MHAVLQHGMAHVKGRHDVLASALFVHRSAVCSKCPDHQRFNMTATSHPHRFGDCKQWRLHPKSALLFTHATRSRWHTASIDALLPCAALRSARLQSCCMSSAASTASPFTFETFKSSHERQISEHRCGSKSEHYASQGQYCFIHCRRDSRDDQQNAPKPL